MIQPLDEIQGLSHLHGHGPWLVCEVALTLLFLFIVGALEVVVVAQGGIQVGPSFIRLNAQFSSSATL